MDSFPERVAHREYLKRFQERTPQLGTTIIQEVAQYQGKRVVTGSVTMEASIERRRVHIWTLDDSELIIIYELNGGFNHWRHSTDSLEIIKSEVKDWLTEPPQQAFAFAD